MHSAMLLNGVDYIRGFQTLFLNAALTKEDIERVIEAFENSLMRLKDEKILPTAS